MPISEDEHEYGRTMQEPQSTMSKAELRKTHKPIMEKRRRARINHCLNEIKTLILEAMNKDPARHSKLEKADILEMAVKHLQNVQRQQLAIAMASDPSVLRKFKNGFNECASEIDKYITRLDGVENGVKQNINSHLQKCISGIEQVAHFNFPGFSNAPFLTTPAVLNLNQNKLVDNPPGDQNNNPRIQIPPGISLIPSRLPTGELALLLPNSSSVPYFSNASASSNNLTNDNNNIVSINNNNQRPSAFVAVVPSSSHIEKPPTPPISPQMSNNRLINPQMRTVSPQQMRAASPQQMRTASPQQIRTISPQQMRTISPRGFRPVQSVVQISQSSPSDHQVPQITSTSYHSQESCTSKQTELKSIKYPIHNVLERRLISPKKFIEPLCIITNQAERYKQAQMKEDSAYYEENMMQGVKRKFHEHQGLLTVAPHDYSMPPPKILKMHHEAATSSSYSRDYEVPSTSTNQLRMSEFHNSKPEGTKKMESAQEDRHVASSSRSSEGSNDMWRPW